MLSHVSIRLALLAVLLIVHFAAADEIINKREADDSEVNEPKRKRPFCNAFTGCGRKRSDDSIGALVDMNAEPAVAELSRQILSEAKMWEAIQEARAEMLQRHRTHQGRNVNIPEQREFALSFRKKRDVTKSADQPRQPKNTDGPRRR